MTDEEYYEFIQPYEDAKQMLLTRLDVLNHNLYGEASARPIHNIQCRIKKKQSIEEKLQRKGKEPTVMNAKRNRTVSFIKFPVSEFQPGERSVSCHRSKESAGNRYFQCRY